MEPLDWCGPRGGKPRVVFDFTIAGVKVVKIDMLGDPERLDQLDLTILND